jgi:hypothetical protein
MGERRRDGADSVGEVKAACRRFGFALRVQRRAVVDGA